MDAHRELEDPTKRSALFQLRGRLERLRLATIHDADASTDDIQDDLTEEQVAIETDGECPDKPDEGNPAAHAAALASGKPRALFGRRRTHNEQLIVNACGVIAGRVTMFGSEGIDGARVALKGTYPTPESVPQVVFYDNACRLKAHLNKMDPAEREHFKSCALPVDAFHMKTKHKASDQFCADNCNPVLFDDLMVGNQWRFNSSVAEMTNAWFGGFQAMVREMRADRYDFFLDEMIKWRNTMMIAELNKKGADCRVVPADILLYPNH
ncbi:hypothetical protein EIP91_010936 [Steccherinum ochraceum]|uniref:CxC6 like cysteine cluster associated with KDZ domain-containing protein n=1 Tax=Steccherinum ochraceum TaxID=92696 RepID=A0A4R0R032_9APHY|nr:hypothetical protein EIP91_010936 [Steccherinum ochraceum]